MVPDDDQAMALPCASVMVIMVLLNVAFTCATPEVMFLRSRRRRRGATAGFAIFVPSGLLRHRLLAGDRPGRSLAGARVGVRALTAHRQTLAMAQAAIAAEIHQPLDVHRHLPPEIAFDGEFAVDELADAQDLVLGQF